MAEKIYYNRFPGSNFICAKNIKHEFIGGQFKTDDERLQKELDVVADIVGSPIYTKEGHPVITPEDKLPASEVQTRAAEVMAQLAAAKKAQGG